MKDAKIAEVLQEMLPYLDNSQMEQLQRVLQHTFWNCSVEEKQDGEPPKLHIELDYTVESFAKVEAEYIRIFEKYSRSEK